MQIEFSISTGLFLTFGTLIVLNCILSFLSKDWRLQHCSILFLLIWLLTNTVPYSEPIANIISFLYLTRLQIKRSDEDSLCYWIVPVILAEVCIFLTNGLFFTSRNSWSILVNLLFAIQLITTVSISTRIVFKKDSMPKLGKKDMNICTQFSFAKHASEVLERESFGVRDLAR